MSQPASDRFLEACGLDGPFRLAIGGPEAPGRVSYNQPFVVVGRNAGTDLSLGHPQVSAKHAYLQVVAGRAFCVDLASRTGIRWEGEARPSGWVGRGGAIGIGPYEVRWASASGPGERATAADDPPPTSRAFALPSLAEATLEHLDSSVEHPTWRINRTLVLVGRSRFCKVRLPGPDVSSFHCSLIRTPEGVWVVDLLGRGGIRINGEATRSARLDDGDELRVGPYRIRLRYDARPARPVRSLPGPATPGATEDRRWWSLVPSPAAESALSGAVIDAGMARIPATQGADTESALLPLIAEFGQMQQQMAEQFQQALMIMFRMFSDMHQDQSALIREELARIRELSEEQRALQMELGRRPAAPPDPPILRMVAADPGPAVVPAEVIPGREPEPAPEPAPEARAEVARGGTDPGPGPSSLGSRPSDDVHAMLVRRLAAIQDERQGRWQKLLDTIMGRGSPGAVP